MQLLIWVRGGLVVGYLERVAWCGQSGPREVWPLGTRRQPTGSDEIPRALSHDVGRVSAVRVIDNREAASTTPGARLNRSS